MRIVCVSFLLCGALIAACGSTGVASPGLGLASPPTTLVATSPSVFPATTAPQTVAPTVRAFPTASMEDLAPGRYDSSPPFDLVFTFEISDEGWHSAHMHDDFFDVMRFDGPDPVAPTSWVAWALPENVIGGTTEAAADLSPAEAAQLMAGNPGVLASEPGPYSFLGRGGVVMDLNAEAPNTHIFGSSDGNFGLDPAYDMRIGIVDNDPGLLFVLCIVPEDGQPMGCGDSQSIIDSVAQ